MLEGMSLTDDDLKAIQGLLGPLQQGNASVEHRVMTVEQRITTLEQRIEKGFDTMLQNFDALFARDEARGQEYTIIVNQLSRLEERVSALEKKCA